MMTSGRIVRKTKFRKREKILHSEKKFHVRKKKFRMRNIVFRTIRTIDILLSLRFFCYKDTYYLGCTKINAYATSTYT